MYIHKREESLYIAIILEGRFVYNSQTRTDVYRESKKQDTKLLPITSQILTDFQNSFTCRLSGTFAKNHI